jgi:hypothetical protein
MTREQFSFTLAGPAELDANASEAIDECPRSDPTFTRGIWGLDIRRASVYRTWTVYFSVAQPEEDPFDPQYWKLY